MNIVEWEQRVSATTDSILKGRTHIKLLEAGCGARSHVRFTAPVYAVGLDISKEQLERNAALQEKIVGDVQSHSLPKEEFDVVVCWMVLEHLPRPKDAMLNLFRSVKPEGVLILAIPNLLSFKGIATKITPFWFHRFFYSFIKDRRLSFPTYLRLAILPRKVTRFAEENGFSVVLCQFVEDPVTRKFRMRVKAINLALAIVDKVLNVITLGKSQSLLLDNCAIVLKKIANGRDPGYTTLRP